MKNIVEYFDPQTMQPLKYSRWCDMKRYLHKNKILKGFETPNKYFRWLLNDDNLGDV